MTENCRAFLISFACLIASAPIAGAKDYPIKLGVYISHNRSIATIKREDGQLLLSVSSRPVQGRGSSAGADCELRAIYNSNSKKWELIPFSNEMMNIELLDISKVNFIVTQYRRDVINIYTDFSEKYCAIGVSFDQSFRFAKK